MHTRLLLPALVSFVLPTTAFAGAPNYDCTLRGGAGRLAVDQWRPKVVAIGVGAHRTVGGAVADVEQDGPSLDLTATLAGVRWRISIRAYGRSLTMTSPAETLTGRCLFVPGNFILRAADRGGHALRAAPRSGASRLSPVQVGAPVWESPTVAPEHRWLPIRVVRSKGLRLVAVDGWLRQAGPYQARAN